MGARLVRSIVLLLIAAPTALPQLPEAAQRSLVEAIELASNGRFNASESILLGLENQYPEDAELKLRLGLEALAEENLAVVHNLLGRAYRLKGDPAKAVDELQAAVRLDPETPSYYSRYPLSICGGAPSRDQCKVARPSPVAPNGIIPPERNRHREAGS